MSLLAADRPARVALGPEATLLCGYALPVMPELLRALEQVLIEAPFRVVYTPGGQRMSAALSACGPLGWHADAAGYRYVERDPQSGKPWPALPDSFDALAAAAAAACGFASFRPDACLMNRYLPGAKMGLHQDSNERDLTQPIVSVSLGLPTAFVFGGPTRSSPTRRVVVEHGDVAVWGGVSRLYFHGVEAVPGGVHPDLGSIRVNLTFRKAR